LPVFFPPEGCLGHTPVHAQPGPVDPLPFVVGQQAALPHCQEDAGADPLLEAIVGRGARAEAGGVQRLPLAAGAQDVEDGLHANAVGRARLAAAEPVGVGVFGNHKGDSLPQVIGDGPLIDHTRLVHVATSVEHSCS
jgi:hypothetical protein